MYKDTDQTDSGNGFDNFFVNLWREIEEWFATKWHNLTTDLNILLYGPKVDYEKWTPKIKGSIRDHDIILFRDELCQYACCQFIEEQFAQLGVDYDKTVVQGVFEMNQEGNEKKEAMLQLTHGTTLPQLVIGGKVIGNCS